MNGTKKAASTAVPKTEHYRQALIALAHRAAELADSLGDSGRALTEDERQLMAMAQLPTLQAELEAATIAFMMGRPLPQIMENLTRLFTEVL